MKPEYLYIATDGKLMKIGICCDIIKRRRSLRSPRRAKSKNRKIVILRSWHRPNDARVCEADVTGLLRHGAKHGREWFDVTEDLITRVTEDVISLRNGERKGFRKSWAEAMSLWQRR